MFSIYKNVNRILSKKQRKAFKKGSWKVLKSKSTKITKNDKGHGYVLEWYRNPSEEKKEKKHQYGLEQYKKFIEGEKQRLFDI